jgi:hypothetical protein
MFQPFSFFGTVQNIVDQESLTRMTIQVSGSVGYNQTSFVTRTFLTSASFKASGPVSNANAELYAATTVNTPISSSITASKNIFSDTTLNSFPSNSISCSGAFGLFTSGLGFQIGSVTMVYKLLPNWYKGNPPVNRTFQDQVLFNYLSGSLLPIQTYYETGIYITSASLHATASLGIGVETPTTITNYWMSGSYYVADLNHPLTKFELINNNLISNNSSNWYSFPGDKLNGMDGYQFLTISAKTPFPLDGNTNSVWSIFSNSIQTGYPGFDTVAPYDNSNKLMLAAFIVWQDILTDDEVSDLYSYFKNTLKYKI